MIRELTAEELPLVAAMGVHFYQEANLPGTIKPEVFVRTWSTFLDLKIAILLGAFQDGLVGTLGAVMCPDPCDGDLVAQEMFWYVLPEHRGFGMRLLKGYERMARERGAKRISMVHLHAINENLGAIYERGGYRKLETQYMKEL